MLLGYIDISDCNVGIQVIRDGLKQTEHLDRSQTDGNNQNYFIIDFHKNVNKGFDFKKFN